MKVKPILFSTPMVQAILDDRKSMTRRVNKEVVPPSEVFCYDFEKGTYGISERLSNGEPVFQYEQWLPYQPGDILYVKETWTPGDAEGCEDEYNVLFHYKADDSSIWQAVSNDLYDKMVEKIEQLEDAGDGEFNWRPSIFMPRAAARIWLKVTDVRCERLQEITEQDAKLEGVGTCGDHLHYDGREYRCQFEGLWNLLNAKRGYGWDTNPWVFVISFERIEKQEERL